LPIVRQCQILQIARSGVYRKPVQDRELNQELKRLIKEIHSKRPDLGSRRMFDRLRDRGYNIGRHAVRTLMRKMGIKTVYCKPSLSKSHPHHKKYPYLLRGLEINRPNQVWATDITYIPTAGGNCYLMAIIAWASRLMLSWRLSNTMDTAFCMDALHEAIDRYGTPEIFNSDQGSQFTSLELTNSLISNGIKISMDGKGRWVDNVIIERAWRSVKYEEVYLKTYESIVEARKALNAYFEYYNCERHHQGLDRKTPYEVNGVPYPNRGQRHEQAACT
jgi:putative transposase